MFTDLKERTNVVLTEWDGVDLNNLSENEEDAEYKDALSGIENEIITSEEDILKLLPRELYGDYSQMKNEEFDLDLEEATEVYFPRLHELHLIALIPIWHVYQGGFKLYEGSKIHGELPSEVRNNVLEFVNDDSVTNPLLYFEKIKRKNFFFQMLDLVWAFIKFCVYAAFRGLPNYIIEWVKQERRIYLLNYEALRNRQTKKVEATPSPFVSQDNKDVALLDAGASSLNDDAPVSPHNGGESLTVSSENSSSLKSLKQDIIEVTPLFSSTPTEAETKQKHRFHPLVLEKLEKLNEVLRSESYALYLIRTEKRYPATGRFSLHLELTKLTPSNVEDERGGGKIAVQYESKYAKQIRIEEM